MFCWLKIVSRRVQTVISSFYLRFIHTALPSVPVNGSKSVEVLQHDAVKIFEAIQFPEIVQVDHSILPQPRNLTERPDNAAAFCVCLSDHRHTAAAAHSWSCQLFCPGQRQHHRAAPHTPPSHPGLKNTHSALPWATLILPGKSGAIKEAGLNGQPPLLCWSRLNVTSW